MSLAGLKKQFNKANQYMSEKIGGAEATKLTDDFVEMERKTDATVELVDDLIVKTKEYLQPNPASRAKLMAVTKFSKLSGQSKNAPYPQPEGLLGEGMIKHARNYGEESLFSQALIETGEALKQMADIKYALEDNVKQNFLEPLHQLQTKDLKDVMHHRKKLQGRRLDYDCKKRKQTKGGAHITDEEIKMAEDKFGESLQLAQLGMHHLLENDVEQITQLAAFADALLEYHKQCADVLQTLTERLVEQKTDAVSKPRSDYVPKKLHELNVHALRGDEDGDFNGAPPPYSTSSYSVSPGRSPYHSPARSPMHSPVNPQAPLFPPTGFDTGFPAKSRLAAKRNPFTVASNRSTLSESTTRTEKCTADARSPARSPMASPMTSNTPRTLEPLFPPGGPPRSVNASPLPSPMKSPAGPPPPTVTPHCKALYDFDPENEGELGFKEADIIVLNKRIDENWFEGTLQKTGQKGFFPVNYVEVVVNLP